MVEDGIGTSGTGTGAGSAASAPADPAATALTSASASAAPPAHPARLTPDTPVTVRLLKHPRPDVRYPATVLADDGVHVVVRAPWSGDVPRDFGFVRFEPGDVWTEHFWRDRWYSIKEVATAGGAVKGWYCDVARPATVVDGEIRVADLDLDLWRSGDGAEILRLDEDEFAESGLTEREPRTAEAAVRALDELAELAGAGFPDLLAW